MACNQLTLHENFEYHFLLSLRFAGLSLRMAPTGRALEGTTGVNHPLLSYAPGRTQLGGTIRESKCRRRECDRMRAHLELVDPKGSLETERAS